MLIYICALLFVGVGNSALVAAEATWSKLGIGYDEYKQDTFECGKLGYFRDVSKDEPAKQFIRGYQTADDNRNKAGSSDSARAGESWGDLIRRTQLSRKMKQVHEI